MGERCAEIRTVAFARIAEDVGRHVRTIQSRVGRLEDARRWCHHRRAREGLKGRSQVGRQRRISSRWRRMKVLGGIFRGLCAVLRRALRHPAFVCFCVLGIGDSSGSEYCMCQKVAVGVSVVEALTAAVREAVWGCPLGR